MALSSLISLVSFPIEAYSSSVQKTIAIGTAFYYKRNENTYLVTNWHNLTGINSITQKQISDQSTQPDILRIKCYVKDEESFLLQSIDLSIYLEDTLQPKWLIHPTLKQKVDIAVIEIKNPQKDKLITIQDSILELDFNMKVAVSEDVFVLGFPLGIRQLQVLPIWKRGTIATEPLYDFEGEKVILIDTATTKGMSGSPVLSRTHETGIFWEGDEEYGLEKPINKHGFLGIYSGRIGDKDLGVQLGKVWKACLIDEIIDGREFDTFKNTIPVS